MEPQTIAGLRDLALIYLSLLLCLILLLPLAGLALAIKALQGIADSFPPRIRRVEKRARGVERGAKVLSNWLVGGVAGAKAILSGLAETIHSLWGRW